MKAIKVLSTIVITLPLLSSCAQPEMKLPQGDQLVNEKLTQAPVNYMVYPDDRPSIPDGKVIWEKQNCASCHGTDGAGTSSTHQALNDNRWMSQQKPVDLYKFITFGDGKTEHPLLQTKLSNREIWNLVAYTRSLACPPLSQADIDAINPVFGSNCAVCHGTKGDGEGPLAHNLEPIPANFTTFRRFYDRTDDVLFDHIANGIKWEGMPNFLGKEDKKKGVKFDHAYIRKLVAYVRNFHFSNEAVDSLGMTQSTKAPVSSSTSTSTTQTKDAEAQAPAETKDSAKDSSKTKEQNLETSDKSSDASQDSKNSKLDEKSHEATTKEN